MICLPEEGDDYQSATSNALLRVLGLKGRVLIGDRALVEVLQQEQNFREKGKGVTYLDMGKNGCKRAFAFCVWAFVR